MNGAFKAFSRREFLHRGARLAGLGVAAGAVAVSINESPAADQAGKTAPSAGTGQTIPAAYKQAARFDVGGGPARRIAIDPENRVYVACGNSVRVFSESGSLLTQIGLSSAARCVAVAGDGTLYAGLRDHVEVFDRKGARLAAWDTAGPKTWLTGLAVTDHDLFAADSANRRILRYDRTGKLLGSVGEKNKDREIPGLIVPSPYLDVKVAPDGLLRVNNPGRHRVEAYTFAGDLEFFWGKAGAGPKNFCGCCNPVSVAMLSDGRHITCEKGLPRVKLYSAKGEFGCAVAGPESFPANGRGNAARDAADGAMGGLDAAVDSRGRIYILDLVAGDVRIMEGSA